MPGAFAQRIRAWLALAAGWFRRGEMEQRLEDEMRFHIEMATERGIHDGLAPDEARRIALAEFGGRERWKDHARDEYRGAAMDSLAQDVRGAARAVKHSPAFFGIIGGTVLAGVALLTVAFSVVDAALWREPPFDDASRIAVVYMRRTAPGAEERSERWSYARLNMLRKSAREFSLLANFSGATVGVTGGDGEPESVVGEIVSPEYFPLLRVTMLRGRGFAAADDGAGGRHPVAVISFDLWQRRFAGGEDVIGKTLEVAGFPLTIIGVTPRGFRGIGDVSEIWIPTTMAPALTYSEYLTTNQNFISVLGRLRPGATLASANAELATLGAQIDAQLPPNDVIPGESDAAVAMPLNVARAAPAVRRSLVILLGAVALLHLLACANVINLVLGRAAARQHEAALRAALGCSAVRLVRQVMLEIFAVASAGGALGVLLGLRLASLVAVPANVWFARYTFRGVGAFDVPAGGVRVAIAGAAIALATSTVAAIPAALFVIRANPLAGLGSGARAAAAGGTSLKRPSWRGAIVALETALAVILVAAAGLMVASFARLRAADLGIRTDHLVTFWIRPSEVLVPPSDAPRFVSSVLDAIAAVPGVTAASVDGGLPLSGSASSTLIVMGRPVPARLDDAPPVDRHYVGPNHFKTLGIPLIRGRVFTDADDANHPRVTVISQTAASRFWPGADPIGQRVWFGGGSSFDRPDSSAEIVGIVGDVADEPLDGRVNRASFYTSYRQFTYATRAVFVRTAVDPASIVPALRKAVAAAAPGLPLNDVQTMEQRAGGSWARHRFDAILFAAFGAVALILAAVGTYAVVAYAVARRTRETGIRLALGALPHEVVMLVVREGLSFPAIGLVLGIVGAVALTDVLRASLYAVQPSDPRVLGATAALLLAVSALACLIPALRATNANPADALRAE